MSRARKVTSNILTAGEAAKMLGISARTFTKWVDKGLINSWKINKDRRVLKEDVLKLAAEKNMPVFDFIENNNDEVVTAVPLHNVFFLSQNKLDMLLVEMDMMRSIVLSATECLTEGKHMINEPYYKVEKEKRAQFFDQIKALKDYKNKLK